MKRIVLQNFKCFNEKTIEFGEDKGEETRPPKGFYRLLGKSGQGKSTIFEAFEYCFYGKNGKALMKWGSDHMFVEVVLGGNTYKRVRKGSSTVFYKNGEESKEEGILGLSYEEFCLASYISQGSSFEQKSGKALLDAFLSSFFEKGEESLKRIEEKIKGLKKALSDLSLEKKYLPSSFSYEEENEVFEKIRGLEGEIRPLKLLEGKKKALLSEYEENRSLLERSVYEKIARCEKYVEAFPEKEEEYKAWLSGNGFENLDSFFSLKLGEISFSLKEKMKQVKALSETIRLLEEKEAYEACRQEKKMAFEEAYKEGGKSILSLERLSKASLEYARVFNEKGGEGHKERLLEEHKERMNELSVLREEEKTWKKKHESYEEEKRAFLLKKNTYEEGLKNLSIAKAFLEKNIGLMRKEDLDRRQKEVFLEIEAINGEEKKHLEMKALLGRKERLLNEKEKYSRFLNVLEEEKEKGAFLEKWERLKRLCKESFGEALEKNLLVLNLLLEEFCTGFFKENILGVLSSSEKGGLEFSVFVDGEERSFSSLSGGQKARINVALLLSFSELFGLGFLFLDEAFNGLENEKVFECLSFLQERFSEKLVVFVEHAFSGKECSEIII